MKKLIIKIDICGSKEYVAQSKKENIKRNELLDKLTEIVKNNFPYADKSYPDGTLYSAQGDCVNIILERPNVGIRSTVNFMKKWYSLVPSYPDCRAIISYSEIRENTSIGKLELLSAGFEEISIIEKKVNAGEIFITSGVKDVVDPGLFIFTNKIKHRLNSIKSVLSYQLNYLNPRISDDNSLVHALFVADSTAAETRVKTFEVLAIEYLINEKNNNNINNFIKYLENKNCPSLNKNKLKEILKDSKHVNIEEEKISLNNDFKTKLDEIKENYQKDKNDAIDQFAESLSGKIGLDKQNILDRISLDKIIEEYLCSIFLEIRMMANYYKLDDKFFEKLVSNGDYDHIFHKYINDLKFNAEEFLMFKILFLNILKEISKNNNRYFASIFHNVLMLYYLNKNEKYVLSQIEKLKEKQIFIDTNVLYSIQCKASEYNDFLSYALDKLSQIGIDVYVFDISVCEYNESILNALHRYKTKGEADFRYTDNVPWILNHFMSNRFVYGNDFDYCVKMHTIPKNTSNADNCDLEELKKCLFQKKMKIEELSPFEDKDSLGEYYDKTVEVKRTWSNSDHNDYYAEYDTQLDNKVIHDANCIKYLKCVGDSPYETKNIFITCDYKFARIRKMFDPPLNYLSTVKEFQEFMMPYLLLDKNNTSEGVVAPNFLLASTINIELSHTANLESMVGKFLRNEDEVEQEYEVLSKIKNKERFEGINEKFLEINKLSKNEKEDNLKTIDDFLESYEGELKQNIGSALAKNKIDEISTENKELKNELEEAKLRIKILEKRKHGKEKYDRSQKRKNR